MATVASHNTSNASVKRILREVRQISEDPSPEFVAGPLEDDLFDWHCTVRGPKDTEFEGGLYHVRIQLPSTYPFRPPSVRVLTPNGRFEVDTPICISFTNYHEELWQPAWGIRTAIIGLQGFFPQSGDHAAGVGALHAPPNQRKRLATLSRDWTCPQCKQRNIDLLPDPAPEEVKQTIVEPDLLISTSTPVTEPTTHLQPPTSSEGSGTGPPPSPTRTIPFYDVAHQTGPLIGGDTDTDRMHQQQVAQAFPAFRNSVDGVPLWLDSAILILSVLVGGIVIHRVMF